PIARQAFDGGHRLAGRGRDRDAAGADRSTVNVQSAGPALRNATAELGAGEPELIADYPEQRRFRRYLDRMSNPIHREVYCHGVPSLILFRKRVPPPSTAAGDPRFVLILSRTGGCSLRHQRSLSPLEINPHALKSNARRPRIPRAPS